MLLEYFICFSSMHVLVIIKALDSWFTKLTRIIQGESPMKGPTKNDSAKIEGFFDKKMRHCEVSMNQ